jgi:hypothetical protein
VSSELELFLLREFKYVGIPAPVQELQFHPSRKWRFDFAWPDKMVACEVEGGTYMGGRHQTADGFQKDCEKYNEATLLGWKIIRVTADQIATAQAVTWLEALLLPA